MLKQDAPVRAAAQISGDLPHSDLSGLITFTQLARGVLVQANVCGLPQNENGNAVFALHIHEGTECTGNAEDAFANAGGHYNPSGTMHPYHAGDLPPLFTNGSCAAMSVITERFTVDEINGRTIIIHANPDDFTSQPSGNAGKKIACGKIFMR